MTTTSLRWKDVGTGTQLPAFERTTDFGHWNRYAAVNDEFVPMHMDPEEGRRAGQRDAFGMGNLRISYLHDQLRDWLGDAGDIVSFSCQFRGYNFKADVLSAHGVVEGTEERDGACLAHLKMGVDNQEGVDTTPTSATVLFFGDGTRRELPAPPPASLPTDRQASENVPQEVVDLLGEETPEAHSYPVGANDIRRWAQAVYYPEPAPARFIDEAVAKEGPHGGLVAPREFNPFAWMPGHGMGRYWDIMRARRSTAINGGQRSDYFAQIRPCDVITHTRRFIDVYEKEGRSGSMVFVVSETRWTNQDGALVKVGRNTLILI